MCVVCLNGSIHVLVRASFLSLPDRRSHRAAPASNCMIGLAPQPYRCYCTCCRRSPHPCQPIHSLHLLQQRLPQCWQPLCRPIPMNAGVRRKQRCRCLQRSRWWRPVHNALSQGKDPLPPCHHGLGLDNAGRVCGKHTLRHLSKVQHTARMFLRAVMAAKRQGAMS